MIHKRLLVDTDILSSILKGHDQTVRAASLYLEEHGVFSFSILSKYEILRGLMAVNATAQAEVFLRLCDASEVLGLSDASAVSAAEIYADLKRRGALIGDVDILIASTAIVNQMGVVTNNETHFMRVPQLTVENWMR